MICTYDKVSLREVGLRNPFYSYAILLVRTAVQALAYYTHGTGIQLPCAQCPVLQ